VPEKLTTSFVVCPALFFVGMLLVIFASPRSDTPLKSTNPVPALYPLTYVSSQKLPLPPEAGPMFTGIP
jgi:hypothetical protein